MKTLTQMGIQQWHLKASFSQAVPTALVSSDPVFDAEPDVASENLSISQPQEALAAPESVSDDQHTEQNGIAIAQEAMLETPLSIVDEVAIEDESSLDRDLANLDWPGLQRRIDSSAHCPSCGLGNAHLGTGDINADWMFVVDAPNSREIEAGCLFTGRAGQLFDAILLALDLERQQVYTTSVFKCAPVDDLSIAPQCDELVHRQIALINPKVVIAFGEFAAQALIKSNHKLDLLRQTEQLCVRTQTPVVATYSPAEMLNETALKAFVWQDLKKCMRLVNA